MYTYKPDNARVPIKIWSKEGSIEESAKVQLENCAKLPFIFHHLAVMPDCHAGYGVTIGSVLVTENVVIPNAVGVDIGCGMCAVKTDWNIKDISMDKLKIIMGKIREKVPVGFNHHKEKQDKDLMPVNFDDIINSSDFIVHHEYQNALTQLGTLGGGNHFIEIQKDKKDNVWVMIHSGSRNLGLKVAKYYNELAKELNEKWYSPIDNKLELSYLPLDIIEAKNYLKEMEYCLDFAFQNRKLMMNRIMLIFEDELFWKKSYDYYANMINIHHNYARLENHFGKNVMVHRKGATFAGKDNMGIIPGSMGTKSYIVKGLGNPESFNSCSHGAGRKMGRKEAKRQLDLVAELKNMDDKGIIHGMRNVEDLDEAAGAYKNIDEVMDNQLDMVEIVEELSPVAVIKG